MSKDTELFELCKEVYERTGWKDTLGYIQPFGQNAHFPDWFDDTITEDHDIAPLYTSDYLLEKLPNTIRKDWWLNIAPETSYKGLWIADYQHKKTKQSSPIGVATSPLKVLLMLTLALHEAGEL